MSFVVFNWQQIIQGDFLSKVFCFDNQKKGTAISIGGFDGIHLGHKTLINAVLNQKNLLHGVVTFKLPPRAYIHPDSFDGSIYTLNQKLNFFKEMGLDFAVVIDFSGDFSRMNGEDFLYCLIKNLNMKFLAEGEDFKCGFQGTTDCHKIREFSQENGFLFNVFPSVVFEGNKVSSTRIRTAIKCGDFSLVEQLLDRRFSLDFSSNSNDYQVLPPDGIYNVRGYRSAGDYILAKLVIQNKKTSLYIDKEIVGVDEVTSVEFTG